MRWLLVAVLLLVAGCGTSEPATSPSAASSASAAPTTPTTAPTTAPTTGAARSATASPTSLVPSGVESIAAALPVEGADISWPQCPKGMGIPQKRSKGLAMPLPSARFVVLGLTNSPGFTVNPCLAPQLAWVQQRHLLAAAYSVVSYPDAATLQREGGGGSLTERLQRVGRAQAAFNVATMRAVGLRTPVVWVDVEPVPDFDWSSDRSANAAVVRGAVAGYQDAGYRVGFYSVQSLWQRVVGDLRLGLPEWRAAGLTSRAEALRRCGAERMFQGGAAVMSQWVDGSAETGRDRVVTCTGTSADLDRWFHQY